jgi:flagellar motor protein MotB
MKFYEKAWFMWLTLILFAPVGIFLLWKYSRINKPAKIALSVIFGLFFITAATSQGTDNTNTTNDKVASESAKQVATLSEDDKAKQEEDEKLKAEEKAKKEAEEKAKAEQKAKEEAEAKAKKEAEEKEKAKIIQPGMYKIGKDLPAGEYVLIGSGYMQVSKDSTGELESIIANDNIVNRSYIKVKDGQYLTIKGMEGYKVADAPKVEINNNILPEGMYKAGIDIKPGEYKVKSDGDGYVEVSKNSTHDLNAIVSNDNFEGEKYITVKAGQYIKLNRAELILK